MKTTAQELLQELKDHNISIYLKNGWITTQDQMPDHYLIRLSKCASEMRALLKSETRYEFGKGVVIGPVSGHESEYWGSNKNES